MAIFLKTALTICINFSNLTENNPPRRPGFCTKSGHVGFMVDKVALGRVFSEYFGFPCQFSFHRLLHTHHLSSRAGAVGQLLADLPSGLSLTPPQEIKKVWKPSLETVLHKCHLH
jgi:hypothetical protein